LFGANCIVRRGDAIIADCARALEVEDTDRGAVALNVLNRILLEDERAAARGVDTAQIDILHGNVVNAEIVELAERVIRDDAIACVDIGAAPHRSAVDRGIVAIQREVADGDVIGRHQDDRTGTGTQ
jgi:hypothetical protein